MRGRSLLPVLLLLSTLIAPQHAHESCCANKARLAKLKFIPDENETPPAHDDQGRPRFIQDPDGVKPEWWDDDDDGSWEEVNVVPNPLFSWQPRLIPNPDYNPPTFLAELELEIRKALPWVTLGVVVTALLEALQLPVHLLASILQRVGPIGGAVLGLATPLCSCGALPVAASFVSAGVPARVVVAFLIAAQSAGFDSAAITWGLLGPHAALCRLAGAVVLAVAAGLAVGGGAASGAAPSPRRSAKPVPKGALPAAGSSAWKGLAEALKDPASRAHRLARTAVSSAAEVFHPVLLGLMLSTAAVYWLPSLALAQNFGAAVAADGPAWARTKGLALRAAVIGSSVPLQLCEHSTVTVAAGIQKAGGDPGLAFAFLLAAPAVNLPSLLLLAGGGGGRSGGGAHLASGPAAAAAGASPWLAAARLTFALTTTALLLSYAVDMAGLDLLVDKEEEAAHAGGSNASSMDLPAPFVALSPWIAGVLAAAAIVDAATKRLRARGGEDCCGADAPDNGDVAGRSAKAGAAKAACCNPKEAKATGPAPAPPRAAKSPARSPARSAAAVRGAKSPAKPKARKTLTGASPSKRATRGS
jgi:uncharacterized membrane protein YraQ (UPF0718 family)